MDLSRFSDLLERAFLEFRIRQTRQRLSVSLNSFAKFLDFSPPIVNQWLTGGRLPTPGNVERIIPKLVELIDLDVYDSLGLPRPDIDLQRLTRIWNRIPILKRQELADLGEKFATEENSGHSDIETKEMMKKEWTNEDQIQNKKGDEVVASSVSDSEITQSSDKLIHNY